MAMIGCTAASKCAVTTSVSAPLNWFMKDSHDSSIQTSENIRVPFRIRQRSKSESSSKFRNKVACVAASGCEAATTRFADLSAKSATTLRLKRKYQTQIATSKTQSCCQLKRPRATGTEHLCIPAGRLPKPTIGQISAESRKIRPVV